jgi:hypothetical protein
MSDKAQPDWQRAQMHLEFIERVYNEQIGIPGVNVMLAITIVIQPLRARFNRGERTAELYDDIMALE